VAVFQLFMNNRERVKDLPILTQSSFR